MKPRHDVFLEALPKHNYEVAPSAIEAGYSKSYANKRGKVLYQNALKAKAEEIRKQLNGTQLTPQESRELMSQIVGLDKGKLMELLVKIATQDKDYASALKVIAPLVKEHGVVLTEEQQKTTAPVLVVGVREREMPVIEGDVPIDPSVEPLNE